MATTTQTSLDRARVMRAVKSRDTKPEMIVRRLVHGLGYRYRLHLPHLPGKPDLAFPGRRKVVFMHGCFWHGHDCARGARVPKDNRDYWTAKIARNKARDAKDRDRLRDMGWSIFTVWECETKDPRLESRLRAFLDATVASEEQG
ncbi:MAG: very short patch repair endonuclease [Xanthobacteraceae bacterium]